MTLWLHQKSLDLSMKLWCRTNFFANISKKFELLMYILNFF
jgi:hypothetical protein